MIPQFFWVRQQQSVSAARCFGNYRIFFTELDGWDPMTEDYLANQYLPGKKNMNNRQPIRRNVNAESLDTTTLYVKRVPKEIDDEAFRKYFSTCGTVQRAFIQRKGDIHEPVTYGFITYSSPDEAQRAIARLNGAPPFQFDITLARKKKDDRGGGKQPQPSPDKSNVFNPPLVPAGNTSKGLAAENGKQGSDTKSILKVTAHDAGRDVHWNSPDSVGSPEQQSLNCHNKDEDNWSPRENDVDQVASNNGPSISSTAVPHQLHNNTNSAPNHPKFSQSRYPAQGNEIPSSHGTVFQSRNSLNEVTETDFSSMPFLSTYIPLCFACDGKGVLCCSACTIPYCSPECQRKDWPHHKHKCAKLASCLDHMLYQQSMNAVNKTLETKSENVNFMKKREDASPPVNPSKKTDGISSSKKSEMGPSLDVNIGMKPHVPPAKVTSKISENEISHGKDRNWKKNEGAMFKGRRSPCYTASQKGPTEKHPVEKQIPVQLPESKPLAEFQEKHKFKASDLTSVVLNTSRNEEVDMSFAINPGQFWVQKASNRETLQEIGAELLSLSEKKTKLPSPAVDDICAAHYSVDNCLYRGRITEVKNNMYSVYYFDYGNTETVQASSLYNLNEKLMSYPSQAVSCKLGGVKPPKSSNEWSESDISAFTKAIELSSAWEARVIKSDAAKCEIDLLNSGTSLAAVLVGSKNAEYIEEEPAYPQSAFTTQAVSSANINMYVLKIPTVFTRLKSGSSLTLMQVYALGEGFYVHVKNDADFAQFVKMQLSFSQEAHKLKDISSSVQKYEFAVALSPEFGTWNRCFVVDKKEQKSLVRYIDYGNEEEVSSLYQLELPCSDVSSPLIYCDFSHLLLSEKESVKNLIEFNGVVKKSEDSLTFDISNKQVSVPIKLLPWWQGLSCNASLPSEKPTASETDELVLPVVGKTSVKVVWANCSDNQVYIQKLSLESKIENLEIELNAYCNSDSCALVPSVGDMVCALFVDNKWYRCCVKEILPEKTCSVHFVDYGNDEVVKFENIRKLPARYSSPSSYYLCVSLCGLQSVTPEIIGVICDGVWDLEVVNPSSKPTAVKLFRGGKDLQDILVSQKLIPSLKICGSDDKYKSSPPVKSPLVAKKRNYLHKDIREFESAPVSVVFVDGNKCPHLHLVSDAPKLVQMQNRLNDLMQKDKSESEYSLSTNDIVCAVFSEDNVWYRGIITEIVDADHCGILFVDYGNTGVAELKTVRPLPEEFAAIPIFSLQVLLRGVPVDLMDHRVEPFLADTYKLVVHNKSSVPVKVELFSNERSVNQLLVSHLAPKKPAVNGEILRSESPQKIEKVSKISSLKTQSLPLHENTEVIFCYGETVDALFVHRFSDHKAIADLLEALQIHCCYTDLPVHVPSNDEIIAARSADGMWYRGHVVDSSADTYNISFIDYGNIEAVPKNLIRCLPPKLSLHPIYSISVKLKNAESLLETLNFTKPYCVKVLDCVNEQYVLEIDNVSSASTEVNSSDNTSAVSDMEESITVPVIDMPVGNNVDLCIYNVYDLDLIFCAPYDEKRTKELLDFSSNIATHCMQLKKCHTPAVNETVFAKHPDDGNWHRAVILEICDEFYQTYLIDCGALFDLEKDSFKKIDAKFMNFPQQSIPCKLGGFLINDENREEVTKEFITTVKTPCRVQNASVAMIDEELIIDLPSFRQHLIEKGIIS